MVDSQEWILARFLPERTAGFLTLSLSESSQIRKRRRNAIYAVLFEIGFCIFCLPLAALRRGLSIFSTVLNIIILLFSISGLYGTLTLNHVVILFHGMGVLTLCAFLLLYLLLAVLFTSSNGTQLYLILIILFIGLVNIVCASFTSRLGYRLWKFTKQSDEEAQQAIEPNRTMSQATTQVRENDQQFLARIENAIPSNPSSVDDSQNAGDLASSRTNSRKVIPGIVQPIDPEEQQQLEDFNYAQSLQEIENNEGGTLSQRSECKICFENEINAVLLPCAHMVACLACSRKISHCPVCRKRISKAQQVFKA
mmetsp:Transcript_32759/g.42042  ORF Transcript_32759/g.42042 Transcript_32759/m.42042 type:complete len:310 (-) Transcript_32759:213-1142(-)